MVNNTGQAAAELLRSCCKEAEVLQSNLQTSASKHKWEAQQLAALLGSVTSITSHAFSRYDNGLFVSKLNTHLCSSAQLLQFGLLKVSRIAQACCCANSSSSPFHSGSGRLTAGRLSSGGGSNSSSITAEAASAAADIQLALTVFAAALQYLEACSSLKQAETAAGRQAGSSASQHPEAAAACDPGAADASHAWHRGRPRSSTAGEQRQLPAGIGFEVAAGSGSSRAASPSPRAQQRQQQQAAAAAAAGSRAGSTKSSTQPQDDEISRSPAYRAAQLMAVQELLLPGTTWAEEEPGRFVHTPSAAGPTAAAGAAGEGQRPHTAPWSEHGQDLAGDDGIASAAGGGVSGTGPQQAAGDEPADDELDPSVCGKVTSTKIPLACTPAAAAAATAAAGEAEAGRSSASWLQEQLQQLYSNSLLQGARRHLPHQMQAAVGGKRSSVAGSSSDGSARDAAYVNMMAAAAAAAHRMSVNGGVSSGSSASAEVPGNPQQEPEGVSGVQVVSGEVTRLLSHSSSDEASGDAAAAAAELAVPAGGATPEHDPSNDSSSSSFGLAVRERAAANPQHEAELRSSEVGMTAEMADTAGGANRSSLMTHVPAASRSSNSCSSTGGGASAFLAAEALLCSGNAAYSAGRYESAAADYTAAMGQLPALQPRPDALSSPGVLLWMKSSLNLACCHLRLGQFRHCLAECDALLQVDPANIVALCHRGRALLMLHQTDEAHADLSTALQLLQQEAVLCADQQHTGLNTLQCSQPKAGAAAHAAGADARGSVIGGPGAGGSSAVARMRLNNCYWQQRVEELLSSLVAAQQQAAKPAAIQAKTPTAQAR